MKNIVSFIFVLLAIFSSCQQDSVWSEQEIQTRSVDNTNTFVFYDSYINWNNTTLILDYVISAYGNLALDKPITISYKAITDTGYSKVFSFIIPAGSTGCSIDGTMSNEMMVTDMGLNSSEHSIQIIELLPISYEGDMKLVGTENLGGVD